MADEVKQGKKETIGKEKEQIIKELKEAIFELRDIQDRHKHLSNEIYGLAKVNEKPHTL